MRTCCSCNEPIEKYSSPGKGTKCKEDAEKKQSKNVCHNRTEAETLMTGQFVLGRCILAGPSSGQPTTSASEPRTRRSSSTTLVVKESTSLMREHNINVFNAENLYDKIVIS